MLAVLSVIAEIIKAVNYEEVFIPSSKLYGQFSEPTMIQTVRSWIIEIVEIVMCIKFLWHKCPRYPQNICICLSMQSIRRSQGIDYLLII